MSIRELARREVANTAKRKATGHAVRSQFFTRMAQWTNLARQGRLQGLRDQARDVKNKMLNNHALYLQQFTQQVQINGGHVHFAATGEEAVQHVVAIARKHNAKLVVKSKSMVSEEIHLNPALEAAGIEPVETDLGEYIVQLAGEAPVHIVGPALHKTRYDVAELFEQKLGGKMPTEPEELTMVARRVLREKFLTADIGITGANFGIAETGTVVIVTNEGNGRMVTTAPRVMITVMGLEKLVPTWAEFEPLFTLLPRSATGQNVSVYVSAVSGPRKPGEIDGPAETHVIVLDNGRSKLLGTKYQDALRCIRCGACLNGCPVFRQVTGHGYGSVYSGPIGTLITPLLQGVEQKAEMLDLCSLCGQCEEVCPVQIPLTHMINELRSERPQSPAEKRLFKLWAWAWSSPGRYRLSVKLASWLGRLFSKDGHLTWAPGPLAEWHAERDFPAPAARSLRDRWADLEREVEPDAGD